MTLSPNIILPLPSDYPGEDNDTYFTELVYKLQNMYQLLADQSNGLIRNNSEIDAAQWIPILKGTTADGTFTYTSQYGQSLRQGIITDVWFDVTWSAQSGGTGDLYLELPYIVGKADGFPFAGSVQTSTITYGTSLTYATCSAIPNTYRLEFFGSGASQTTANIAIQNSGRVVGHCRYLGVSDG